MKKKNLLLIRMALINARDLHKVCHPHYLINILLAFSFLFLKLVPPFCSYLFKECQLEHVCFPIIIQNTID